MTSAVVVLSGGQDSTTSLYWARQRYDDIHAVTFDYGQSHRIEVEAAIAIGKLAGVASIEVVRVPGLLRSTSPLTDTTAELETYADFATMDSTIGERVELTFVPTRNLTFFTIAANRAVARRAKAIVTGICEEDNANYPDCRETFAHQAEGVINLSLGNKWSDSDWIRIVAPLMHLTKADSIRLAASIPGCFEALALSHTCYAGAFPPCGACHACVLRAHGFKEAGVEDPLILRAAAA